MSESPSRSRARASWYDFTPEIVVLLGLGLFAVSEPHASASAFRSTKAVALMVAVAIGWLVVRLLAFALVSQRLLRALPFALGALVILKIVVFPAYDNHTVVETLVETTPLAATEASAPAPPSEPIVVRRGTFAGVDHRATGMVNLYRRPNGAYVVGLEAFDIQPGPAYAVYVVPGSERRDHDGGTRLAALRGNRGAQFDDIPSEVKVTEGPWTVLVWCETFDVPVAHATLT